MFGLWSWKCGVVMVTLQAGSSLMGSLGLDAFRRPSACSCLTRACLIATQFGSQVLLRGHSELHIVTWIRSTFAFLPWRCQHGSGAGQQQADGCFSWSYSVQQSAQSYLAPASLELLVHPLHATYSVLHETDHCADAAAPVAPQTAIS